MFSSLGWGEIFVLIAVALVVLGPERLPGAIQWVMGSVRKVRDYANGASNDLQEQLGTDFDSIREPLQQLGELRQMTPRAMVTKALFDGDSSTMDEIESSVRDSLDTEGITKGFGPSVPLQDAPSNAVTAAPEPADPSRLSGGENAPSTPSQTTARKHDVTDWDAT